MSVFLNQSDRVQEVPRVRMIPRVLFGGFSGSSAVLGSNVRHPTDVGL
jgi:hypothetical protein